MTPDLSPEMPSKLYTRLQQEDEATRAELKALWRNLEPLDIEDRSIPTAADTWEGIEPHLDDETSAPSPRGRRDRPARAPRRSRRAWVGAALLLLVLVGAWVWWSQPVQIEAPPGTYDTATLPDGSTVELNAGTRLSHPRGFNTLPFVEANERTVHLSGEAYFEVAEGDRPFVVTTSTARIEVLGTKFNVRAHRSSTSGTHVMLTEGQVRVQSRSASDTGVTLQPGQVVRVDSARGVSSPRDTSATRVLAWRQRGIAVAGQPLHQIFSILERRSGQSITLDPSVPESKRSETMTLYYPTDAELTTILHDICVSKGLNYRPVQDGYVVTQSSTESSPR